jgi:protein O-GlcNAc transferase
VAKNQNKNLIIPESELNTVLALYSEGKISATIADIKKLNEIYPNVPFLFNLLGACYQSQGHLNASIQMFKTAVLIKSDYAEAHFNLGVIYKITGQLSDAVESYKTAISFDQRYFDAFNNLGNVLHILGLNHESISSYHAANKIRPDNAEVNNNLASVYKTMGRLEDSETFYRKAIDLQPDYAEAFHNLGVVLKKTNNLEEALECYERAENLNPNIEFILGPLLQVKKNLCNWDKLDNKLDKLSKDIKNNKSIGPFFLLGLIDNPQLQKLNTEIYVNKKYPNNNSQPQLNKYSKHKKIRIGYFSADFHNHATMHLMAELFECHDKDYYEIFAFSFGPNVEQEKWRERVYLSFDKFMDVSLMSEAEIAALSRQMEIDIAVDLKGFTKDSRPNIFLERCAPIQISYLGYPGTMSADFIDYLIADQILIPKESQNCYTEKIVYMPDSYQVNMSKRKVSKVKISRKELGLPEDAFVFCCFNNAYKISPLTFKSWMRILTKVKDSVIWLLIKDKNAIKNLQQEAEKFGVDKERLVFASYVDVEDHLNRIKNANLFLDTLPYNAHTTASDALRVGLPVITCLGSSFASRVAASLLNAVNMSELITTSQESYECLAIELALDSKKMIATKEKLINNLPSSPLFNSSLFTKNLESAYKIIYDRYQADLKPDHLYI